MNDGATRKPGSARTRILVLGLLGCAAWIGIVCVLVLVGIRWIVRPTPAGGRVRWEEQFGSLEAFAASHPAQQANDSAIVLEELGARLPIDLVPRAVSTRSRPPEEDVEALRSCIAAADRYLHKELKDPAPVAGEPPGEVAEFLSEHAAALDAIVEHLRTAEVPLWEMNLRQFRPVLYPNLQGQRDLQVLLLVRVLAEHRWGRPQRALDAFEASWRLNESLRERPQLECLDRAMTESFHQASVLRKLAGMPPDWGEELLALDYRAHFLEAMQAEALFWTAPAESEPWLRLLSFPDQDMPDAVDHFARAGRDPIFVRLWELGVAGTLERTGRALAEVEGDPDSCAVAATDLAERSDHAFPFWNSAGPALTYECWSVYPEVRSLELTIELTCKVLQAKAARHANGGAWPAAIPEIENSATPGGYWIYGVSPGGVMTLRFSRNCTRPGYEEFSPVFTSADAAARGGR